MRYAISYVSTATPNSREDIQKLLEETRASNLENNISGILLFSEGNFFQVLEGSKDQIKSLYTVIAKDKRHRNLIKIFERPIQEEIYDGYECDFVSEESRISEDKLEYYTQYLKTLDASSRAVAKNVLRAFLA